MGPGLEGVAVDLVERDLERFFLLILQGLWALAEWVAGRAGRRDSRPFPRARRLGSCVAVGMA